jgi:hypothetical protein
MITTGVIGTSSLMINRGLGEEDDDDEDDST